MARATKSVEVQMKMILDTFDEKVNKVLKTSSKETADETAERLRSTSPKKTGDYARGWTVSEKNGGYVVHNATDYQLTHLLENGHVIRNKYGEYGRWSPKKKHIKPVETWANKEFQRKVEEGIES